MNLYVKENMMNDQLTPRKITRLLNLAEGIFPNYEINMPVRDLRHEFVDNISKPFESTSAIVASGTGNCESSSGILDLDCCEDLSNYVDNLSLGKSTFNPGEITGRSTETENSTSKSNTAHNIHSLTNNLMANRHSLGVASSIEQLEQRMRQQSADITHLMRHSVCSSQFTQVDLTAEEKLFVAKEGAVPVMPSELNMNLTRNMDSTKADSTNQSLGGYFQKRCEPFENILPANESPKYSVSNISNTHSIPEAELWSTTAVVSEGKGESAPLRHFDLTLDSVPVRQPRMNILPENPDIIITPEVVQINKSYIISSNTRETNVNSQNLCTHRNFNTTINTQKVITPTDITKPSFPTHPCNRIKCMEMNPPTYMVAPQLQHLGIQMTEESGQEESSLGMSAIICNYLGKESDVRASVLYSQIKEVKNQKQHQKVPLKEVNLNIQKKNDNVEMADHYEECVVESTSSSMKPLLEHGKWKHNNENLITALHSTPKESIPVSGINSTRSDTHTGSKSPGSKSPGSKSSKSQTTYYTVKENNAHLTPPSKESNLHMSKISGGSNTLNVPSPNILYKELDKSVDWRELLAQKSSSSNDGLAKVPDKWVEISVNTVSGFVGVSLEAPVKVTSLVDSWLTARIVVDQSHTNEVTIDVPRFPVLLSPLKSECMSFHITSMVEMKKTLLPFTIYLKDSSIDLEIEQKGYFEIDFQIPMIQTITVEGLNNGITFHSVQEAVTVTKTFVLVSDCPVDLQLDLTISEGNSLFTITNLQEIKRGDIKKCLTSTESKVDDVKLSRNKILKQNKQLCRLTNGNAIKAALVFTAPTLADLKLNEKQATFKGCLLIQMINTNILIDKIELIATVGVAKLTLSLLSNYIHLDYKKSQDIKLRNTGTVVGTWKVTVKDINGKIETNFKVSPELVIVHPGTNTTVNVQYKGLQDKFIQGVLIFKDITNNTETSVKLSGGKNKQAQFPIKTTYSELSWVRKGRKELKIKNDSDRKVTAKFKIYGDGFMMETSRGSGTDLLLSFGQKECKDMLIIFEPSSPIPHKGKLMITLDNDPESAKSVRFYACDAGPAPSWAGLVTCGETALVAASARAPLQLTLHNRSRVPAFISAKLQFNLQYLSVSSKSRLVGARSVVRGRESTRLVLHVDWTGVERAARDAGPAAARTLATLSVLAGAEYTRHRILRILRGEGNGEIKTENLSEHLSRLVGPFEGEDPSVDEHLADFDETRKSLEVLVSGIQELCAQVDLTRELSDDVTIMISDDSMLEYKTLCD